MEEMQIDCFRQQLLQLKSELMNISSTSDDACGGASKVIACIEDPVVIKTILAHLEKKTPMDSGVQIPYSRASPQARLFS